MSHGDKMAYHNQQQYYNAPQYNNAPSAPQYNTTPQYNNTAQYGSSQPDPQAHYPNSQPHVNSQPHIDPHRSNTQPSNTPQQYYNSQPQPVQMMQVAGGNRNALNKPLNSGGDRGWSYGLFDCFNDCGTCVLACLWPCGVYAQNKSRLEHLEKKGVPHPHGGDMCNMDCCCHCCLNSWSLLGIPACGWILQMSTRSSIRTRYRIEGGGCGDCCSAFWCAPCELTQGSQELQLEENSFGKV